MKALSQRRRHPLAAVALLLLGLLVTGGLYAAVSGANEAKAATSTAGYTPDDEAQGEKLGMVLARKPRLRNSLRVTVWLVTMLMTPPVVE